MHCQNICIHRSLSRNPDFSIFFSCFPSPCCSTLSSDLVSTENFTRNISLKNFSKKFCVGYKLQLKSRRKSRFLMQNFHIVHSDFFDFYSLKHKNEKNFQYTISRVKFSHVKFLKLKMNRKMRILRYRSVYMYILSMGIDPAKNFTSKSKSCCSTHNCEIAMFFEDWHK